MCYNAPIYFNIRVMNNNHTLGAMYHIVTGAYGYHDSGFMALMIVSILCYIAIQKDALPNVHCNDAHCIFME